MNAILEPSGDQLGHQSVASEVVTWATAVPSTLIRQMSNWPKRASLTNASCCGVGPAWASSPQGPVGSWMPRPHAAPTSAASTARERRTAYDSWPVFVYTRITPPSAPVP